MAQPYSIRFMSGRGGNRHETYTVPEGKRAVVRSIATYKWGTDAAAQVFFAVHGIPVFQVPPGAPNVGPVQCRYTAYERETIQCSCYGPDWSYAVDGYLFADPVGTPDDADNVITPTLRAEPLPAGELADEAA
jgi:hypothetical protein